MDTANNLQHTNIIYTIFTNNELFTLTLVLY